MPTGLQLINIEAGNTMQCRAWRESIYNQHVDNADQLKVKHSGIAAEENYVAANQWLIREDRALKNSQWRERVFSRHISFSNHLRKQHSSTSTSEGIEKADESLKQQVSLLKIGNTSLFCDSSDQDIRDTSEAISKSIALWIIQLCKLYADNSDKPLEEAVDRFHWDRIADLVRSKVEKASVDFPLDSSDYDLDELMAALARVSDTKWWCRQLRKTAARQYEHMARSLGQVSKSKSIYCTEHTLWRRTEQKKRNRLLLESLEAENSEGQVFTLAELSDLSVSNPVNRRNELMTRISGFEECAKQPLNTDKQLLNTDKQGCSGLFITLTTPSKYHAQVTRKNGKDSYAAPNPKYNGTTPKQAHEQLCKVWAEIRADWDRNGINPYGFRMVEPHHDGTPHWHLILFLPLNQQENATNIFRHHALKEDGNESGAQKNRVKVIPIDPTKGSAAGYCAKYVAKNIDGFGIDTDQYGRDAILSAMRIEAWASTWGIRQFQQIGGPSVTVWREARRVKQEMLTDLSCEIQPEALEIIKAADSGDWQEFTNLMGGAICPRSERPIRPHMIKKPEPNQYGEYVDALLGLLIGSAVVTTRGDQWTIRPVDIERQNLAAASAAANAPPLAA